MRSATVRSTTETHGGGEHRIVAARATAPVVKLFTPNAGATWLLCEIDREDDDRAFGLCDLGQGFPGLGYVSLTELEGFGEKRGLPIERDLHFIADKPLSGYAREARLAGRIVA